MRVQRNRWEDKLVCDDYIEEGDEETASHFTAQAGGANTHTLTAEAFSQGCVSELETLRQEVSSE